MVLHVKIVNTGLYAVSGSKKKKSIIKKSFFAEAVKF